MHMAYTKNPHLPRIRREAAHLVLYHGWSTRKVARHTGFNQSTIVRWVAEARKIGFRPIPTRSSKPRRHPRQLSDDLVRKIVAKRFELKRSAEVIHFALKEEGVSVSLSSVKRTLDRRGLLKKRSPWKRFHPHVPRPRVEKPGSLVQLDTIHRMIDEKKRLYVYVAIDVCSRWVYAKAYGRMSGATTLRFLKEAQRRAVFHFDMLQSDHGPEFGKWFVAQAKRSHRYTRIGKPNDNAHIERFNRTIQEECLDALPKDVSIINRNLPKYLRYYNGKRHHFGLNLQTPLQVMQSY
jgi:transposase InsO family protein